MRILYRQTTAAHNMRLIPKLKIMEWYYWTRCSAAQQLCWGHHCLCMLASTVPKKHLPICAFARTCTHMDYHINSYSRQIKNCCTRVHCVQIKAIPCCRGLVDIFKLCILCLPLLPSSPFANSHARTYTIKRNDQQMWQASDPCPARRHEHVIQS